MIVECFSQVTRKHFAKNNDYMDIMHAAIPIPNVTDYNLLLLDEYDISMPDRKYMPLSKGENEVGLPNT